MESPHYVTTYLGEMNEMRIYIVLSYMIVAVAAIIAYLLEKDDTLNFVAGLLSGMMLRDCWYSTWLNENSK